MQAANHEVCQLFGHAATVAVLQTEHHLPADPLERKRRHHPSVAAMGAGTG
jgi:hypothetical protein